MVSVSCCCSYSTYVLHDIAVHHMSMYCNHLIQQLCHCTCTSFFSDCRVLLCDFHREQAWSRWLRKGANNVSSHKTELLARMRQIARAANEEKYKKAVADLKNCPTWRQDSSDKFRQWFEGTWLKESKVGYHNLNLVCTYHC